MVLIPNLLRAMSSGSRFLSRTKGQKQIMQPACRRKRRESVGKASGKILEACRERESITIPELAALIGITERSVQRNIQKLQADGLLRRVGGRKEGYWEVVK